MKKILLVFLAAALVFSCQKKEAVNLPQQQSLVFSVNHVNPDVGLKATLPCVEDGPDYAWVNINGQNYYPDVYQLDGKWYTQAIKLDVNPPTSFTVNRFSLWHLNGASKPSGTATPLTIGDELVMATPNAGATYSEYVTKPTPFTIPVTAFEKAQVPVEVLCFQPESYTDFGFDWFSISRTVLREQCFFGDICLNGDPYSPADFNGSLYGTALGNDVPAIMEIHVYKNGVEVPNSPFTNEANQGIGNPLCVQYPDNLDVTGEVFTFKLWLWLKTDAGWSYQLYHIYSSTDDGTLLFDATTAADLDGNGVVEFVVGTCNYSDTDHTFPWICPPNYYQPFDSDDGDWLEYPGPITISGGQLNVENGAFTRFDGYLSVWPGTWTAEIDVYLDPAWADNQGFDYSVAAQGTDGNHRRDYVWHVGQVPAVGLLVNADNNSYPGGAPNSYVLQTANGGNYYTVTTAGWYTLQQVFYDNGGVLAVDFNLIDTGGTTVWTVTRSDASDLIPDIVGGNRYGWFVFANVSGGISADNAKLIRECNQ